MIENLNALIANIKCSNLAEHEKQYLIEMVEDQIKLEMIALEYAN